jgi:hypothetical protein
MGNVTRKQGLFVALWAVAAAGCGNGTTQPAKGSSTTPASAATDGRPSELKGAAPSSLGAACFLEMVNNVPVRQRPGLRAGTAGVFSGWASVSDPERPVPPIVYVVLRRQGVDSGLADVYLKMGRMPRPDLGADDKRRELVGFEGAQQLPPAGTYRVQVSQGTPQWQVLCDTGANIEISG